MHPNMFVYIFPYKQQSYNLTYGLRSYSAIIFGKLLFSTSQWGKPLEVQVFLTCLKKGVCADMYTYSDNQCIKNIHLCNCVALKISGLMFGQLLTGVDRNIRRKFIEEGIEPHYLIWSDTQHVCWHPDGEKITSFNYYVELDCFQSVLQSQLCGFFIFEYSYWLNKRPIIVMIFISKCKQ